MKVRKKTLLFLACIVWMIAGFNVLQIGILVYRNYFSLINIILSLVVFILFQSFVFSPLVCKHTRRILEYEEEYNFFLKFFDLKSFIIMTVMIVGGIYVRVSGIVSEHFIAVFYSGLGASLFLAGILFGINYYKFLRKLK